MAFVLVAVASVSAQDIFFSMKEGQTLIFANLNARGRVESYTSQTIKSVTGSGRNFTIEYVSQAMDKDKNPVGGEIPFTIKVVNGVLEMDLKSFAAAGTEGMVEITGDPMRIPASLNVGDTLPDGNYTMVLNLGFKITTEVKLTEQECLAVEEIRVPAGTFTASKLTQTSVITQGRRSMETKTITWLVPGVGAVRTENYDQRGRLQSSIVLHEIIG